MDPLTTIKRKRSPAERASAASAYVDSLVDAIKPLRITRNMGLVGLVLVHGQPKAAVARDHGVSRSFIAGTPNKETGKGAGLLAKAPAELPAWVTESTPESLSKAIKDASAEIARLEAEAERGREVRDDAVLTLLFEEGMPNHEVAQIANIDSVRVAQLRRQAATV